MTNPPTPVIRDFTGKKSIDGRSPLRRRLGRGLGDKSEGHRSSTRGRDRGPKTIVYRYSV